MPTKDNIVAAFKWFTEGAAKGDSLFLHFSGHGGSIADKSGDEADGRGLHSLTSNLNSRTFGNSSPTLELNLSTLGDIHGLRWVTRTSMGDTVRLS